MAPAVIFCWCLFFSIQGCKDPIIEDKDLLTSDDNLNIAKDTLHVKLFTEFEMPISSNSVTTGLLGSISDPNFGNTYAGVYAQCQLTTNNIFFGENPVLDSVVLTLRYTGKYGAFDQAVNVSVYELDEALQNDVTYKTNDAFRVKLPTIGQLSGFTPKITDSVVLQNGVFPPHLRVPLTSTFGNKILLADTNVLRDNPSFLNLFKGFYITTSSSLSGNGLLYTDLNSSISGIYLYYHNNSNDSLVFRFPISGVRLNHIDHSYTGTPIYASVNSPNPGGEEKMFLQGGAGAYGKILITDLDSLPKNIAINKAEIIFSQSGTDTPYLAPLLLDLFRIDDAGQAQLIDDDGLSGFGGVRAAESVNGEIIYRYRFNFKKYFQKLIQSEYRNNGFYLKTYLPNAHSERVVITNSSTDRKYQVTLLVTYTRL